MVMMTQNNDNNSDEQLSPEIEERKAKEIILLKNWAKDTPNIGEKISFYNRIIKIDPGRFDLH